MEMSVATKILNSSLLNGDNKSLYLLYFWCTEALSFMIIGVASLFKAHLLLQERQAHV